MPGADRKDEENMCYKHSHPGRARPAMASQKLQLTDGKTHQPPPQAGSLAVADWKAPDHNDSCSVPVPQYTQRHENGYSVRGGRTGDVQPVLDSRLSAGAGPGRSTIDRHFLST